MTTPEQKLANLIPSPLTPTSSRQDIINTTYSNNVGQKMLAFIYQLQNNVQKKHRGGDMCPPRVTWTPTTATTLNCGDNLLLFGVLGKSDFYRIANVYAHNVQQYKMYMHMKSQGKTAALPLSPT